MKHGHPSRGQIWLVDLNPVIGHEQGEKRPALVVSADALNHGPSGLVTVLPITKRERNIPVHIKIRRGDGGLTMDSWILCDQVRTLSRQRLIRPFGDVEPAIMVAVEDTLRIVLGL